MTFISLNNFTKCESFSLTNTCVKKVLVKETIYRLSQTDRLNFKSTLKTIALRVSVSIVVPLLAIADFFIHLSFSVGKTIAVIFTLPFRSFVQLPVELSIESPLIHLSKALNALFQIVVLSPLLLVSPDKAFRLTSLKDHLVENNLNQQIEYSKRDLKNLKTTLSQVKLNRNLLRQQNSCIKAELQEKEKLHTKANEILAQAIELINDLNSERVFLLKNSQS